MRIGALFAVFVYTVLAMFVAIWLIIIGLGALGLEDLQFPKDLLIFWVDQVYSDPLYQFYVLMAGIGLMLLSFVLWTLSFTPRRREKQVLFRGDGGEVLVNLSSPIEAIVKEVAGQNKEVVDVRQDAYMQGKTLIIEVRVVMRPGVKIKEVSERMQDMIIAKVREIIGLESPVKVRVKVLKVVEPKRRMQEPQEEDVPIPFRNMDV